MASRSVVERQNPAFGEREKLVAVGGLDSRQEREEREATADVWCHGFHFENYFAGVGTASGMAINFAEARTVSEPA